MKVEFILLVMGLLFFLSIVTDKVGNRFGIPALLLFLTVGMVFNLDTVGLGGMSIGTAEAIGSIALCIILFSGGMDTKIQDITPVIQPGITMATIGVLLTCAITGVILWLVKGIFQPLLLIDLPFALLIAATMSSTDSASVFSTLRTRGIGLKHGLRPLLELESGANDPMAYILTTTLIGIVTAQNSNWTYLSIVQDIFVQLVVGVAIGFLSGRLLVWLMRKIQLSNESLYPIMVLAACIFIYGIAFFMKGNSFLAVYIGGLIIGNSKFTRKRQTKSFFDGLTWLSQLVMFLLLGLMVNPKNFFELDVWTSCLLISLVQMFISRPIATFLSLQPFSKYTVKDKLLVSWVGLKGGSPIIFAILCLAQGVPNSHYIFNVVFLCTIISLLAQGTSMTMVAKKLELATKPAKLRKLRHFDLDLPEEIQSSATELEVTEDMLSEGCALHEMHLPSHTLVIMVRRGEDFFVPAGQSELQVGDQLLVITDDDAILSKQFLDEENQRDENSWRIQMITNTFDFLRQHMQSFMNGHK